MTPPRTARQGKFVARDHLVRTVQAPDLRLHLVRRTINEKRHAFTYETHCGIARLITHRIAVDTWRHKARDSFAKADGPCPECAAALANLLAKGPHCETTPKKPKRTSADD